MKKLFSVLTVFFTILSFSFAYEDLFSFSAGISSGIPAYGRNSLKSEINMLNDKHRFIIGTMATVNLNPVEQATFFTGMDLLADFNWNSDGYLHFFHFSFPLGVKIFPGLKGFDFGLAYSLGFRTDVFKYNSIKTHDIAGWSNGFKLFAEYDFAHCGSSKYYPTIGLGWNMMPRGNHDYDNIVTIYLLANF